MVFGESQNLPPGKRKSPCSWSSFEVFIQLCPWHSWEKRSYLAKLSVFLESTIYCNVQSRDGTVLDTDGIITLRKNITVWLLQLLSISRKMIIPKMFGLFIYLFVFSFCFWLSWMCGVWLRSFNLGNLFTWMFSAWQLLAMAWSPVKWVCYRRREAPIGCWSTPHSVKSYWVSIPSLWLQLTRQRLHTYRLEIYLLLSQVNASTCTCTCS